MTKITIYTDGAAKGNPGNGGYGVVMMSGTHYKELSQGYRKTTNNRMELLAVIVALESVKSTRADITVFSDSKYVVDAIEKGWLKDWQKKDFKGKKNVDLWQRFLKIYPIHLVKFCWVKGHNGNQHNERCDVLAVKAAEAKNLMIDTGYEAEVSSSLF